MSGRGEAPLPAAVFFDIDDTLSDCESTLGAARRRLLHFLRERCPDARDRLSASALEQAVAQAMRDRPESAHDFGVLRRLAMQRLFAGLRWAQDEELLEEASEVFVEARSQLVLLDGAKELLAELKRRGTRVATVTNGNADITRCADLAGLVDAHVTAAEAGARKPDPRPFAEACRRVGCEPGDVVYVGDSYDCDVVGAAAVGMRAILLLPYASSAAPSDVAAASAVAKGLGAVLGALEGLGPGAGPAQA